MEPYVSKTPDRQTVACTYPGLDAPAAKGACAPAAGPSLFFPAARSSTTPCPGESCTTCCAAGRVDGMSLLCCGKILSFEPDGQRVRAEFERQMCDHVVRAGVRRIVAACPNCVAALRSALARDARTADVQVDTLPQELANMGYRIDEGVLRRMVAAEAPVAPEDVAVCVHDSCPDRSTGEFADGTRALLPGGVLVETAHVRNRSFCCGSLVRAAGKLEAADKQARRHGEEAEAAGAAAVVTACVSCAFQLSTAQRAVPVFHYLELLYDWRVDWAHADQYMKLRFLFDAEPPAEAGNRAFVGLEGADDGRRGVRDAGAVRAQPMRLLARRWTRTTGAAGTAARRRGRGRTGPMAEIKRTNCHYCGYCCAFLATVEDGRVTDLAPDPRATPMTSAFWRVAAGGA